MRLAESSPRFPAVVQRDLAAERAVAGARCVISSKASDPIVS